jgi:hypothetical protein
MRKIKIEKWKVKSQEGNDLEESLLVIMNVLLSNKKPEELPRGLDNFRLMGRLSKAFKKAEEKGTLELEEADYSFLKNMIEKDIVGLWGVRDEILKAVDDFLNAKQD